MKKIVRLTESQLYRLIEQTINEMADDYAINPTHLQIIADAFIGQTVNCDGDASHNGITRQVGDAQWMDKKEANKTYLSSYSTRPLYYHDTYMAPRMGDSNTPVLVLFDTKGRCITWINHYMAINLYMDIRKQDNDEGSVIRLY